MILFVVQNTNAGGSYSGAINEHQGGVGQDDVKGKWAAFDHDGAAMPTGAAFSVQMDHFKVLLTLVTGEWMSNRR